MQQKEREKMMKDSRGCLPHHSASDMVPFTRSRGIAPLASPVSKAEEAKRRVSIEKTQRKTVRLMMSGRKRLPFPLYSSTLGACGGGDRRCVM